MSYEFPSFEQRPGTGERTLPVHGFVLAGGKSSRMGRDKALLPFRGRPMVEIAVEKLRGFCAAVSIVGNREDLSGFAPVVTEARVDCGPAAGIEAGLTACTEPWAMFVPVDVPLVPGELLRRWAEAGLTPDREAEEAMGPLMGCSLFTTAGRQPAFCMLRKLSLPVICAGIEQGERRLDDVLETIRREFGAAAYIRMNAAEYMDAPRELDMEFWFSNVNTPQELAEAEAWATEREAGPLRG